MKEWNKKMQALFDGLKAPNKTNYLQKDGKEPKNDLLPGIGGGPLPNISSPGQGAASSATATTDEALREALEGLAERAETGAAPAESTGEAALGEAGKERFEKADSLRENATAKGDRLYEALVSYATQQDGRYGKLIDQISEKGYRNFAGVADILASYAGEGDRAAGYAAANGAADNGGNPDSYAAAQAARQRLAFTEAGNEAALGYYNDQLDRWLSALTAAGKDAASLYGLAEKTVESTHTAATEEGKRGEGLFDSLADLQGEREEADADRFSALLSHYEKLKAQDSSLTGAGDSGPSPMELDKEFESLVAGKGVTGTPLSKTDALIALWQKYPTKREYLLEKYQDVLNQSYHFDG